MNKTIRIAVILLSILMLLSVPVSAMEEDEACSGSLPPMNYIKAEFGAEFPVKTISPLLKGTGPLPSSYSSVDLGYVTDPKNQSPYGACWAFSVTSMAETSMIAMAKRIDGVPAAKDNVDFSELHLVNFLYGEKHDPLGYSSGDGTILAKSWEALEVGGDYPYAMWALAAWTGLADEADVPYSMAGTDIDPALENTASVHLKNAYAVPIGTDAASLSAMKNAILDFGSVGASYWHADAVYDENEDEYLSYDSYAYYYNGPYSEYTNHAIVIVGWDDDFAVDNFVSENQPPAPGAWLVKNSWGTYWGNDGYFWMSYYDESLQSCGYAFAFEFEDADTHDFNYQYDGGTVTAWAPNDFSAAAATYTVKGGTATSEPDALERIEAVGLGIYSTGTRYSVQIFKNSDPDDPMSGEALLDTPVTGTTTYSGFTTIDIPKEAQPVLKQGDVFSVAIKFPDGDGTIYFNRPLSGEYFDHVTSTEDEKTYIYLGSTRYSALKVFGEGNRFTARVKAYSSAGWSVTPDIEGITIPGGEFLRDGENVDLFLQAAEGYSLPDTVEVTVGGEVLESYMYFYESGDGELMIDAEYAHGNVVVYDTTEKCGPDLVWSIDDVSKTLTITGTGTMYTDYEVHQDFPWKNNGNIESIVIEEGVTGIGSEAFYGFTNLQSITLPRSLAEIGSGAFAGCSSLSSIILDPENTTFDVDGSVLYKLDAYGEKNTAIKALITLEGELILDDNIVKIDDGAFAGCSISAITFPDSVEKLGAGILSGCTALKEICFEGDIPAFSSDTMAGIKALVIVKDGGTWTASDSYKGFNNDTLSWMIYDRTNERFVADLAADAGQGAAIFFCTTGGGKQSGLHMISGAEGKTVTDLSDETFDKAKVIRMDAEKCPLSEVIDF